MSHRVTQTDDTPRCGARIRADGVCQCRAMENGKCFKHGGASPGAPRGPANGRFRDGFWTRETVEERRFIQSLLKSALNFGAKP